ncbi:MAG: VWA domain-containing protein, partial [Deltaproteobacteria bacterium]|nr:VWA domain-containing protein [Deltaproteobacteria bacterium]
MRWGDLRYLILLALFPVLVLFLILTARSYRKKLLQFCEAGFLNRLIPFQSQVRPLIKRVLYGLTFLFFVLTLIEPKWGYHFEDVVRKGVDLMLIVDVSNSMMAEDMKPNRLEREKRKIVDLLKMAQGDRIGLIVFAGKPILLCPLTLDYQTIDQFLEDLSTDLIPIQGTDLKGAIDLAIKSFKDEKSQKALMIFSDGEDFGEDLAQATGKLKELKIPAYIMGFGTPEGAPIPSGRGEGGFKRDDSGNLVVSKLNERALSDLALATGGEYVRSVTNDDDLNELYTKALKGAQQGNEIKTSKKRVYESRFQWPLGIALFLIILEFLISENRRKQKLVSLSIFLFVVVSFHSNAAFAGPLSFLDHYRGWKAYQDQQYPQAQNYFEKALVDNPKDQQMAYNLGNSYYRNGDYLKAAEAFQKAIEGPDIPLREKAFYNLGNSNFKGGQWERAVEAYENALKLDSKDEEA